MRTIQAEEIRKTVAELCIRANTVLPEDVRAAMERSRKTEPWPTAQQSLDVLLENLACAKEKNCPICQDTGLACVFLELGQDVHIEGDVNAAVNAGVHDGYCDGYLRKSAVGDPLRRVNTEDNTPTFLTVHLVPGDGCRITLLPKGFGSENMSRLAMLKPADGVEGVKNFVLDTVRAAGPNPCPPIVIGVGIGGTFDKCAALAKQALLRPLDQPNADPYYADLERELLEAVNALGIGPQGFGGKTTALGLNIETAATHVAGLPVAVNINCHAAPQGRITVLTGSEAPAQPEPASADSYTVVRGDCLWNIAVRFYGDGMKFRSIAAANGLKQPWVILPGQTLTLPAA